MNKPTLLLIFACAALCSPARAAFTPQATALPGSVPQGFNYQGRLEDNGFPVTATKSMVFRVYDALSGGNLLWTSPAQSVSVTLGLFNATVPVPVTTLVGGGARYLEVQIAGTTMSPRELLSSVPYALIAKSVEGTIDVSTSGLSINSGPAAALPSLTISSQTGNVGISTTNPNGLFTVGAATFVVTTAGNVGIGTDSPDALINIVASRQDGGTAIHSDFSPRTTVNQANLSVGLHNWVYAHVDPGITDAGTFYNSALRVARNAVLGDATDNGTLAVLQGVNVIYGHINRGTSNPITTLAYGLYLSPRVQAGTVSYLYDMFMGPTATGGTILNHWALYQADTNVPNYFGGRVGLGTTAPASALHLSSGTLIIDGTSPGITVGVSTFVVTGGKVGIGTTTPSGLLELSGSAGQSAAVISQYTNDTFAPMAYFRKARGSSDAPLPANSGDVLGAVWGSGYNGTAFVQSVGIRMIANENYSATASGTDITFNTTLPTTNGWVERLRIAGTGNIGFGSVAPATKLHMSSGTLTIDGNTATAITTVGNVGIGTTSPGAKLDVAGGSARLTAVAGVPGSVNLFSTLTVGAVACAAQCGANTACLAAWDSAGVASTCAAAAAGNRCLCSGFGD